MKEVVGKYNSAKIFTDVVDEKSLDQVRLLCDQEFVMGSKIRMMPDIHAGAGCTIGTTMTVIDRVCPNLVGVDIGCGMQVVKLSVRENEVDLKKLDGVIRKYVPSGFNIRSTIHPCYHNTRVTELDCYSIINGVRTANSIGTLGGGNHFIELDKDDEGYLYLVVHSGSRHLGKEIAEYYQKWAIDSMKSGLKNQRECLIEELKRQGREKDISKELVNLSCNVPDALCSIGGKLFHSYLHDMEIAQEYATWNRIAIVDTIVTHMGWSQHVAGAFETIHNYIDTENMILRKGAVSARKGEKLLIPINMRDGSLICVGKGNPDWNYSAPHGAGRLFGRMEAKRRFSVDEFKNSMDGIYTTSVGQDTLDECPMAYKSMDDIVNNIGDTVDILKVIKPIYNFKASE